MPHSAPTQGQVLEDLDLLDSWKQALGEYKKYHSIALKGKKVDRPLPKPKKRITSGDSITGTPTNEPEFDGDTADSDDYEPGLNLDPEGDDRNTGTEMSNDAASGAAAAGEAPGRATAAAMPDALLANAQDNAMKNLLMSWYYAGYYTGLYEGKQQGFASAMGQQEGG